MTRELAVAWRVTIPLAMSAGLSEAAWLWKSGATAIGGARLLTAALIVYGFVGLLVATTLAFVHAAWRRLRRARGAAAEDGELATWQLAATLALAFTCAVGYPINRRLLPDVLSPTSLAVNSALLLVLAPLVARLLHPVSRRIVAACATSAGRNVLRLLLALLLITGTWPLLTAASNGDAPPVPKSIANARSHPNVLLLVIDTLRADHLGAYGCARATSPHLDELAKNGVLFEECISQAPHTKPATASLLTSRVPPSHHVEFFDARLPDDAQTLGEALHDAGYRTGLFSANSFVSPTFGFAQGIDRYCGPQQNPACALAAYQVLNRLRDLWVEGFGWTERPWRLLDDFFGAPFDLSGQLFDPRAAELNRALLDFVGGASGAPWFAHVQYMEAHAPYRPRAEHRTFGNPADPTRALEPPRAARHLFLPFVEGAPVAPDEYAALVANYDACVHDVDSAIDELFRELEKRGELDRTLVVVTADHGEEFFDHRGWGHGQSLHRELVHVPLILAGSDLLPRGRRIATQVRSVDVLPTILDLLGLAPPSACDGESLLPLLRAAPDARLDARPAFSSVQWGGSSALSLRDGERTVIAARDGADERLLLFASDSDPAELHDLSAAEPERAAAGLKKLKAWEAAASACALGESGAKVDEATRRQLERLGYVDDR